MSKVPAFGARVGRADSRERRGAGAFGSRETRRQRGGRRLGGGHLLRNALRFTRLHALHLNLHVIRVYCPQVHAKQKNVIRELSVSASAKNQSVELPRVFEGGDEARGLRVADCLQRAHERQQVARPVERLEQRLVRVHCARHVLQQLNAQCEAFSHNESTKSANRISKVRSIYEIE